MMDESEMEDVFPRKLFIHLSSSSFVFIGLTFRLRSIHEKKVEEKKENLEKHFRDCMCGRVCLNGGGGEKGEWKFFSCLRSLRQFCATSSSPPRPLTKNTFIERMAFTSNVDDNDEVSWNSTRRCAVRNNDVMRLMKNVSFKVQPWPRHSVYVGCVCKCYCLKFTSYNSSSEREITKLLKSIRDNRTRQEEIQIEKTSWLVDGFFISRVK